VAFFFSDQSVTGTGAETGFYTIEKIRFPKKDQKDTIIYNSRITISNIPARGYEYVINVSVVTSRVLILPDGTNMFN
jgi:predicted helicase